MRLLAVATLFLVLAGAAPAASQAQMTVREFNQIAANAPRDPSALLRPSVRRAVSAMEGAFGAARAEEATARRAGRTPPFCIPARTNISPNDVVARMAAVPAARQNQTLTRAVRTWMVERFPCR
jgi:hypothetical protein